MKNLVPLNHAPLLSLEFEKLSFGYEHALLENVDFSFPTQGHCHLAGVEGSGSSSLLKILAGLRQPWSGACLWNGSDFSALPAKERERTQLAIGFSFDQGGLLANYTLIDNLLLPLHYHQIGTRAEREARAAAYLDSFGLEMYARKLPAFVSQTVKKACVLARAFLLEPRMVLLDEPTVSLDAARAEKLADLIRLHQKEKGLQLVVACTEDAAFLGAFDWKTLEIERRRLVQRRHARTGTDGK